MPQLYTLNYVPFMVLNHSKGISFMGMWSTEKEVKKKSGWNGGLWVDKRKLCHLKHYLREIIGFETKFGLMLKTEDSLLPDFPASYCHDAQGNGWPI